MTTKGDTISRLRNMVKAANQDAFITDRYLYSMALKYAKLFIQRLDSANKLARYRNIFEPFPCVDLIEVSLTEACCSNIKTCCTVMRTKDKLPALLEGSFGPLLRLITSIDGSQIIQLTYPDQYVRMTNTTNFKYNKSHYCWFLDGYLYFPDILWEGVTVHGLWEDSVNLYKCCGDPCIKKQDENTNIPEFMFVDIEAAVKNDLLTELQIPKEVAASDNQSKLKN